MWFWWAALAALLSAIVSVLNKRILHHVNASVLAWVLFALNIPFVAWLAIQRGFTTLDWVHFLVGITGSATVFAVAKTLSMSGLKQGRLSLLAPLGSFHPVFTYLLGLIFLNEIITFRAVSGLLLVVIGAYILNSDTRKESLLQPFKKLISQPDSLKVLIAMALTSVSAIFDKTAVTSIKPDNPSLVLLGESLIIAGLLTGYLQKQKPGWFRQVKTHFWNLSLQSLLYALSVIVIFKAFALGPVALAVTIKQMQLIIVLLLGWWWLKDKPHPRSALAALVMLAGAILIKTA